MTATTPQDIPRTANRPAGADQRTLADRAFHLIGIGGAGMSVVAQLLAARGARVSGSDAHGGPAFDHLADLGITTHLGHDAANVPERSTVVVSTAIKETNPELAQARRRDQEVIHRSQALALAAQGLDFVAVAGAHGKTTTSGMLAEALTEAGADPSFAIGGVVRALGTGAHLGGGPALVAEADESDRSFLNYTPRVEIVTNVEPDHLDSYGTAEAFEAAFVDFAHRLVPGGLLVACAADAGALRLAQSAAAEGLRRPERINAIRFADLKTLLANVRHEGFMVRDAASGEVLCKLKSPYYLLSKLFARTRRLEDKLDKRQMDAEYYPLIDHINAHRDRFNGLNEQEKIKFIQDFFHDYLLHL